MNLGDLDPSYFMYWIIELFRSNEQNSFAVYLSALKILMVMILTNEFIANHNNRIMFIPHKFATNYQLQTKDPGLNNRVLLTLVVVGNYSMSSCVIF